MCWNENISLNTFIFSTFVLIFIYYNNNYTQYKTKEFNDWKLYVLFFSFIIMQLVEYFLWKSIREKNTYNNTLFSIIGWIVIRIIQPVILILFISDKYLSIKYLTLLFYAILLISTSMYKQFYNPVDFTTVIGKNNHLLWKWLNLQKFENILGYSYFLFFIPLYMKFPFITLTILSFYVYCFIFYFDNMTWGSMWCWFTNSLLLYFLIKIVFLSPYKEYNFIC